MRQGNEADHVGGSERALNEPLARTQCADSLLAHAQEAGEGKGTGDGGSGEIIGGGSGIMRRLGSGSSKRDSLHSRSRFVVRFPGSGDALEFSSWDEVKPETRHPNLKT